MKILVCDDAPQQRSEEIVSSVREGIQAEPETIVGPNLSEEFRKLYTESVNTCLKDPANCKPFPGLQFDRADIIILDNNLALLDVSGARLTAESFIGHIRAFTSAPYIISLNKNTEVDFDLRF